MHICDKCGKEVLPENDVAIWDAIFLRLRQEAGLPVGLVELLVYPTDPQEAATHGEHGRHLLPTEDCEGSPSRAQYLEGQPHDAREQFVYKDDGREAIYRAAWDELQHFAKAPLN